MVKLALLPAFDNDYARQSVTLSFNDSGRFEDRWVYLKMNPASQCVFTRGIKGMYLPVRHGEGKLIPSSETVRKRLHKNSHVAAQYSTADFSEPTDEYPLNPNGSVDAIAGICNQTGRLYGMMPHPEAYLHRTNHPRWTREDIPEEGAGLAIFRNAVKFIKSSEF